MRFTIVAFATASLVLPTVARADDAVTPAPKEKKICRQILTTGSITPLKRVCLTAAEWAQVEAEIAPVNAKGINAMLGNTQPKGGNP